MAGKATLATNLIRVDRLKKLTKLMATRQSGVTGLETAIILIAFVVVASAFAYGSMSAGLTAGDRSNETVRQGLSTTRGALLLRGAVVANDDDGNGMIDEVRFQVKGLEGGGTVDLTPGQTVIQYSDGSQALLMDSPATFSVVPGNGADDDFLLEPGEVYNLALVNLESSLSPALTNSKTFVIEVMPRRGMVLLIERATPLVIGKSNNLS